MLPKRMQSGSESSILNLKHLKQIIFDTYSETPQKNPAHLQRMHVRIKSIISELKPA